jgi:pSer/pThr/pTyr-binding forkhead associated (FHA) protein
MPKITVRYPDGAEEARLLGAKKTTIGRVLGNDVVLDGSYVSRHHATIELKGQRGLVFDLKSHNGTYVNKKKVGVEGVELSSGDLITVGEFEIRYEEEDENAAKIRFFTDEDEDSGELSKTGRFRQVFAAEQARRQETIHGEPVAQKPRETQVLGEARHLKMLFNMCELLNSPVPTPGLPERFLELAFEGTQAQVAVLLMKTGAQSGLRALAVRHQANFSQEDLPVSKTIVDRVLRERVVFYSADVANDASLPEAGQSIRLFRVMSVICTPVVIAEEVPGALYLNRWMSPFTPDDVEAAVAIGHLLAVAFRTILR